MKRKVRTGATPVEKAIAVAKWNKCLTSAHIHALMGDNVILMIEKAGTLLFIIGLAAHQSKLFNTDISIIHGACRTIFDVSGRDSITQMQRGSIESGLLAIERVKSQIPLKDLSYASLITQSLIQDKGIVWSDFEVFLNR
jgi:hypothetical protein